MIGRGKKQLILFLFPRLEIGRAINGRPSINFNCNYYCLRLTAGEKSALFSHDQKPIHHRKKNASPTWKKS